MKFYNGFVLLLFCMSIFASTDIGKNMALIKPGNGITDIRGSIGGVYFHRDKSGLHASRQPRNIHRRSTAQNKQRNAFSQARAYSTDPRVVSYNIYRALNGLPMKQPPKEYQIPTL